jgi:hypothetical protein
VETVTTSIDTKGRQQPAKRPRKAPDPPAVSDEMQQQRAASAERIRMLMGAAIDTAAELDEPVMLNRGAGEDEELGNLLRAWDRASQDAREKFKKRVGLVAGDGLDIPAALRRATPEKQPPRE